MKKLNLKGKLSLKKETIAKLNKSEMANVIGGFLNTTNPPTLATCGCSVTICASNCAGSCAC